MRGTRGSTALLALALLAACTTNRPLELEGARPATAPAYRYDVVSAHTDRARNSDEILVIVTLSGGGARAAALGYGVLEKLAASRIAGPGAAPARSVLDEVDLISTNSGGSFLAAYYVVHRGAMFQADAAGRTAFERDFLKRKVTADLFATMLANAARFDEPKNRTDLAAEYFGRTLFAGRTYADVVRLGRPYLVINAHDTTKRARFEFTQDQFDLICSDLGSVPLGDAVMASSAVHGVFTPLTLRNFPKTHCPAEPSWIASALRGEGDPASVVDAPQARRARALLARWYREKLPEGFTAPKGAEFYVHLADGAAADNLGLRAPLLALASHDSGMGLVRAIESGRVRRVLFITVNAATGPDPMRDAGPNRHGSLDTMRDAADGLIRTVSDDSLRDAQLVLAQLRAAAARNGGHPVVYGPIVIDFDGIADARRRNCFKRIPTTFDLPEPEVDALREAGRQLLGDSAQFRRFLRDQQGEEQALAKTTRAGDFCR